MIKKLRRDARHIFDAALLAADPYQAVLRHVQLDAGILRVGRQRYRLDRFDRIFVLGAGKASAPMGRAVEKLLGKRIAAGLINVKYGHTVPLRRIQLHESDHPVPDEAGLRGVEKMLALAVEARPRDLVLCLISGGASALLPYPAPPITLAEKQEVTRLLLASGANIHEINAVRKHLSLVKGGQLAKAVAPATLISLLLSDVIGDDLDVIGSGCTVPDSSTFQDAREIVGRFGLIKSVPESVRTRLDQGVAGHLPETPKRGDEVFQRSQTIVVGSNRLALDAAAVRAKELGYRALILSSFVDGETRDVARVHAAIAREIVMYHSPLRPPACVISGGETTVSMRGKGKGGRNQEFAIAAAAAIAGLAGAVILSAGTDGTDGPTDAAGGVVDGHTAERCSTAEALANNDSYPALEAAGDLLKTGPTGTNVMDVRLVLVGKRS